MAADTQNAESDVTRVRATPARQGRIGRDVFVVLVVSLALALLAVFGSWVWHSATSEPVSGAPLPAAAEGVRAPEPAPIPAPPQGQR